MKESGDSEYYEVYIDTGFYLSKTSLLKKYIATPNKAINIKEKKPPIFVLKCGNPL